MRDPRSTPDELVRDPEASLREYVSLGLH